MQFQEVFIPPSFQNSLSDRMELLGILRNKFWVDLSHCQFRSMSNLSY